jgi:hypothetical protein
MKIAVVYHHPCFDGDLSYYMMKQYCNIDREFPSYPDMKKESEDIAQLDNHQVFFVDIFPSYALVKTLLSRHNTVHIFDHHDGNMERFQKEIGKDVDPHYISGLDLIFTTEKSGCQITRDMIRLIVGDKSEYTSDWVIDYVGDRDRGVYSRPYAKEVTAVLFADNMIDSYEHFLDTIRMFPTIDEFTARYLVRGQELVAKRLELMAGLAKQLSFGPMKIESNPNVYYGEVSREMVTDLGFYVFEHDKKGAKFAVFYSKNAEKDGEWWVSLRSNSTNVAHVAQQFGGNGHPMAAGFTYRGKDILDLFGKKE